MTWKALYWCGMHEFARSVDQLALSAFVESRVSYVQSTAAIGIAMLSRLPASSAVQHLEHAAGPWPPDTERRRDRISSLDASGFDCLNQGLDC